VFETKPIPGTPDEARGALQAMALGTAAIAGAATLLICLLLAANHVKGRPWNPLDTKEFKDLKLALRASPRDEALKEKLRRLDLELREKRFASLSFSSRGGYLLLGSAIVFLLGMKYVFAYRRKLPMPRVREEDEPQVRRARAALASVMVSSIALLCAALALARSAESGLAPEILGLEGSEPRPTTPRPDGSGLAPEATKVPPASPSPEEVAKNWPRFRGPGGLGISATANVPTSWNGSTGEGIVWKSAVPLPGENSPVVWGDRIFLTGATEDQREVYSFDTVSGKLLWRKAIENVPGSSPEPPEVLAATGFAASTAAVDGRRVYAIFANADLAALDLEGKQVWSKNVGPLDNHYGHAASLDTYQNLLLVLLDQATEDDGKSKLLALDGATGRVVWEAKRPVMASWSTPIVARTSKGDQLVTSSKPWVIAYDPATGSELWKADCMGGDVAPSPVFAKDLVFAVNADADLVALRTDGRGDVTETHVAWKGEDGLPDITSPLASGDLVFLLTTSGRLTCYNIGDAKRSWEKDYDKPLWEKEFKLQCNASPSLAGSRVYIVTKKGITIMVEAAPEFKELGRAELGEDVNASPVFQDGRIYLRAAKHLYCLGQK